MKDQWAQRGHQRDLTITIHADTSERAAERFDRLRHDILKSPDVLGVDFSGVMHSFDLEEEEGEQP